MSGAVLTHKRDAGEHATQAWNMKALPDEFSHSPEPHRLFVAVIRTYGGVGGPLCKGRSYPDRMRQMVDTPDGTV